MTHGIIYTNIILIAFIAIMLLPETCKRISHCANKLFNHDAYHAPLKLKQGYIALRYGALIIALCLASYNAVILNALISNHY